MAHFNTRSVTRAMQASAALNLIRPEIPTFTSKQLYKLLQREKCPYPGRILSALINANAVVKTNDSYSFVNSEPIHFSLLQASLDRFSNDVLKSQKKAKEQKVLKLKAIPLTEEESAIEFLKFRGYKIMKPITNYEEC